jgi:hypothetical protein
MSVVFVVIVSKSGLMEMSYVWPYLNTRDYYEEVQKAMQNPRPRTQEKEGARERTWKRSKVQVARAPSSNFAVLFTCVCNE